MASGFGPRFGLAIDAITPLTFDGVEAVVRALDQRLRGVVGTQQRNADGNLHAAEPLAAPASSGEMALVTTTGCIRCRAALCGCDQQSLRQLKLLGKFGFVLPNNYLRLCPRSIYDCIGAHGFKDTDCVQMLTRPLAARQRPALVTIQRPQLLCHADETNVPSSEMGEPVDGVVS